MKITQYISAIFFIFLKCFGYSEDFLNFFIVQIFYALFMGFRFHADNNTPLFYFVRCQAPILDCLPNNVHMCMGGK